MQFDYGNSLKKGPQLKRSAVLLIAFISRKCCQGLIKEEMGGSNRGFRGDFIGFQICQTNSRMFFIE
jgi:hypothetical protein